MRLPHPDLRCPNQDRLNQRAILQLQEQLLRHVARLLLDDRLRRIQNIVLLQPSPKILGQIAHRLPSIHAFFVQPVKDLLRTKTWKPRLQDAFGKGIQAEAKQAGFFWCKFHSLQVDAFSHKSPQKKPLAAKSRLLSSASKRKSLQLWTRAHLLSSNASKIASPANDRKSGWKNTAAKPSVTVSYWPWSYAADPAAWM